MLALVLTLAIATTNVILVDALSCSSPNRVFNIKAVAAAANGECDKTTGCDLWIKIDIGYTYVDHDDVGDRYFQPMTWITLLEEHNDEIDSAVSKEFNASIVFAHQSIVPVKYVIRVTVSDDDCHVWCRRFSSTEEVFRVTTDQITTEGPDYTLDERYFIDETTNEKKGGPGVHLPFPNRETLKDVLNEHGSFVFLKLNTTDECLVNDCNPVDLRVVMRINAVVALKKLCDPGIDDGSACDIWMKIEIGLMYQVNPCNHSAGYQTTTWRTMLEEHDSVKNRQVSRVFRGSTSFKNLDEMPEMYTLKITVRDDDDRQQMWSDDFNSAEPVVEFNGNFGPSHASQDIRQGYRKYCADQIPYNARRRRGAYNMNKQNNHAKGLPRREVIEKELKHGRKSFVKLFISTEEECTTGSPNRYYVRNCNNISACHDYDL